MSAAIVADRAANVFGDRGDISHQGVDGFAFQRGVAGDGFV
jgi:hypothetical protein